MRSAATSEPITHVQVPHQSSFAPTHRYDFDKHHDGFKQIGFNIDTIALGFESRGLLNLFGDLTAARTGIAKVNDAHKRMLERVKEGAASADGCVLPTCTLSPRLPPFFLQHLLNTSSNLVNAERARGVPQVLL